VDKLRAITLTSFQETLHRRVLYLVLFLVIVVIAITSTEMLYVRMARQAGETEVIDQIGRRLFQHVLGIWDFAALFLALFLGAIGLSSELRARTIVNVLSRPVPRWIYLLGRWFGVLFFLWIFLFAGILIVLLLGIFFNVQYTPLFWLGLAQMFINATFFSGVSLGLSVVLPPVAAGALTFFITMLPMMVQKAMEHPRPILRGLANIAYYLAPAHMPVDLIGDSFAKQLMNPKYLLYSQVLAENLFYTGVILMLACAVFNKRELRLR
jgi:ABC-type transport system involved in multi-copper enzyme maturation permease subunit